MPFPDYLAQVGNEVHRDEPAFGNQMAAIGMGAQMHSARMGMFGQIIGGVAAGAGAALSGGLGADAAKALVK